jgi:hypothetical protein
MGFFGFVKQVKHERQGGLRESLGIRQSTDSDVRCVECKYVTGYSGTSTRSCKYHGVEVNTSEVCNRFESS